MIIQKALLLLIGINGMHQENLCDDNCLKCSENSKCQICDYTRHYFYQNGQCIQIQKSNCLEQDSQGSCVKCQSDYYLESTRNECIEVNQSKKVENCLFYNTFQNCDTCANRHYIEDNRCIRAVADIENCKYLLSDTSCRECNEGYLLSGDQLSCERVSDQSCLFYSRVTCNHCQQGFYHDQNFYLENFKFDLDFDRNQSMKFLMSFNDSQLQLSQQCRQIQVSNCLVYKNYKECQECDVESYLDENNQCQIKPVPSITHCLKYSTNDICQECQSNYYKESDKSCVPVTPVQFCSKYDGISDITQCQECQGGFYLISQNKCQKRINIDAQCKEYQKDRDKCKACNEGYSSIDQIRCFTKIQNCLVHKQTDPTYLECEKCDEGYHPDGRKCAQGTIENCEKYASDSNYTNEKCEKCQNQYFIVEVNQKFYCENIKKIDQCEIYKGTMDKHCQTCSHQHYPFLIDKKCKDQEGVQVLNCIEYHVNLQNQYVCKTCQEQYYLDTLNNKCIFITNYDDCIKLNEDNSQCIKCKPNKILFNSQCQNPAKYIQEYCSEMDLYNNDPFSQNCKKCVKNTIPKEMKNHVICYQKSFNLFPLIDECEIYSMDNGNPICHRCSSNKRYLRNNQCVSQCEEDEYLNRLDANKVNVCKKLGVGERCKVKVLNDLGVEICVECEEGDIQVVNSEVNWEYSSMNQSVNENLLTEFFKELIPIKCIQFILNSTRINGNPLPNQHPTEINSHQTISQCEYYTDPYNDNNYQCIKCTRSSLPLTQTNGYIKSCTPGTQQIFENVFQNYDQFYKGTPKEVNYFVNNYECQEGYTKVVNFFNEETGDPINEQVTVIGDDNNSQMILDISYLKLHLKQPKLLATNVVGLSYSLHIHPITKKYIQNGLQQKIMKNNFIIGDYIQLKLRGSHCIKNDTQRIINEQTKYKQSDYYKHDISQGMIDINKVVGGQFINILENCGLVGVFYPGKLTIDEIQVQYTDKDNQSVSFVKKERIQEISTTYDSRSYCMFCKPSFRREGVFQDGEVVFMSECVPIENCKSSIWYNGCSECLKDFVWEFSDKKIHYDKCISIEFHENCFAGNQQGCQLCQKSFVLNQDNKCVKEDAGYCQDTTSIFISEVDWNEKIQIQENQLSLTNFVYNLYYKKDFWGCQKCKDDSISVLITEQKKLCVKMEYVENFSGSQEINEETNYIPNCLVYDISGVSQLKCEECNSSYTLTDDFKCKKGVENCQQLNHNNLQECLKCKSSYTRVDNKCEVGDIDHCVEYDNINNSTYQQCLRCQDSYYISNNKQQCKLSKVKQCKIGQENSEFLCTQCNESYGLIKRGSKDYCYPLTDIKCKTGSFIQQVINGNPTDYYQFECQECQEIHQQMITITTNPTDFQGQTMCLKHLNIDNCKVYFNSEIMSDVNFECKECTSQYYLDSSQGICKIRSYYEQDKCQSYDLHNDKCLECKENYILGEDVEQCKFIPDGLSGCYIYENKYKCKKCFENHYLSESSNCQKVADQTVANCVYYKNQQICQECAPNYFLNTSLNKCELSSISSCKIYNNVQSCQECEENYGLIKSNNQLVCVPLQDHNCLLYQKVENSPCIRCKENFYPDNNGLCQPVQVTINNCKYYKTSTLCEQCLPQSVRSLDQTKCLDSNEYVSFISQNCESSVEKEPFCSFCSFGYYYRKGKCQKCIKNGQETGCMQCDPHDEEKCILCLPGYHMNERQRCLLNSLSNLEESKDQTTESYHNISYIILLFWLVQLKHYAY